MKYIDADKLLAEIERRLSESVELKGMAKIVCPVAYNIHKAAEIAYRGLLPFINSLQQEQPEESLGKTLDKAAHQYAWNKQEHHIDFEGDEYLDYGPRYDAFKAGAKWMAEQGAQLIGRIKVNGMGQPYLPPEYIYLSGLELKEGDKVIVQIRRR